MNPKGYAVRKRGRWLDYWTWHQRLAGSPWSMGTWTTATSCRAKTGAPVETCTWHQRLAGSPWSMGTWTTATSCVGPDRGVEQPSARRSGAGRNVAEVARCGLRQSQTTAEQTANARVLGRNPAQVNGRARIARGEASGGAFRGTALPSRVVERRRLFSRGVARGAARCAQ